VIANGDFDDYWRYHLTQEHQRLYPAPPGPVRNPYLNPRSRQTPVVSLPGGAENPAG
jgi:hypothetical protein